MGHYDSCYEAEEARFERSPEGQRRKRALKLREQLKNVTLSNFTVDELEAVMILLGLVHHNSSGYKERLDEEQLVILEKKAKSLLTKKVSRRK